MSFYDWLTIASLCFLGAISPGPSLALVLKFTLNGSRKQGVITGCAHGAGVGIYALVAALGLVSLIAQHPYIYQVLIWAGGAYLVFIAVQMLQAASAPNLAANKEQLQTSNFAAARAGFLMVFLNPKVIIWLAALFAQFMPPNPSLGNVIILAVTAWLIDTAWYVSIALGLSTSKVLPWLQKNFVLINRLSAAILIILAVRVVSLSFTATSI